MSKETIKICIVDDEESIVELLTTYLDDHGYKVKGFTQSEEAREYLKTHQFDVVFTDLKMPGISGLEIVDTVNKFQDDTMVIIFTGYASIDSAIQALKQGVYDYLRKPFKLTEIQAVLDRAVEKLTLGRENIRLNKQIVKMLADITMLYEISSIMYQVLDLNLVSDMILDTFTEGMGVKKAGIFIENESTRQFSVLQSRGLPEEISESALSSATTINGEILTLEHTQVFKISDGKIEWNDQPVKLGKKINLMIMAPIRFMNQTIGYVCVLDPRKGLHENSEEIKLYKIVATQISPLLHSHRTTEITGPDGTGIQSIDDLGIVGDALSQIDHSTKVSFILLQVHHPGGLESLPVESMNFCNNLLLSEFSTLEPQVNRFMNNILCVLPLANPIEVELKLMDIKAQFAQSYGSSELELRCGLSTFPSDGKDPREIMDHLIFSMYYEFRESTGDSG